MDKGFVKVQGKNLVLDGRPVLFHGLGLGSWLNLEHFMLGLPTTDSLIRRAVKEVFGAGTAEQLLALPQAFRFESCGHHPMFLQLLKTHGKKEPSGKV